MFLKIKNSVKDEKGVAAIIVGIALVAIVGILAYAIDTGLIYQTRRSMQTTADAAALAGVQELPGNPDGAIQVATDYVDMQGIDGALLDVSIEDTFVSNDTIKVKVSDPDKKTFFAGIFNINSANVGASATAMVGSPGEYTGVVPWGVLESDWIPGTEYTLKWGHGNKGNFGALSLGGTGANNYRDNIKNGSNVSLHVGSKVDTEPGNMKGPTVQGTDDRIYGHDDFTFNSFEDLTELVNGGYNLSRNDSQYVICPLINEVPNGRKEVTILAFVPFIITSVSGSEVEGTFLNEALIITNGEITGYSGSGLKVTRLIK